MSCNISIVRTPEFEELKQVYYVEVVSFRRPYPYWYLKSLYFLADELFLAAYNEYNQVLGYVAAIPLKQKICHIASIAVKPKCRRRGLGHVLLSSIEEVCSYKGLKVAILEVQAYNWPAIRLYLSHSYRWFKLIPHYYGKGEHAIAMIKAL